MFVRSVADEAAQSPSREGSFAVFFEAHYEVLLRAMYLVAGDRYEAEDLAQEAFAKAYERWSRLRDMENPAGYLYRASLNAYRSRRRRIATAAKRTLSVRASDPIADSDERDSIRRALATLPRGQREAVVLVEWLGMTSEEAGRLLGISANAARVRVHRAKQALRFVLEKAPA
jgi:RNA polymerase sigma-70 factor (ECF subfamily)